MALRMSADTVGKCYFKEDFSGCTAGQLPEGWSSYGAGKTATDSYAGSIPVTSENRIMRLSELFPDNTHPFVMLDLENDGTVIPFCNSTTKEGGEVNEWLISPVIDTSETSEALLLSFDVVCFGSFKSAPFSVYVGKSDSETPEDFKGSPVYSSSFKGSTTQVKRERVYVSLPAADMSDPQGIRVALVCNASGAQLMGFAALEVNDYEVTIVNKAPEFTMTQGSMNIPFAIDLHYPGASKSVEVVLRDASGDRSKQFTISGENALNWHTESSFQDAFTLDYTSDITYEIIVTPHTQKTLPYSKKFRIVCREGYPSVCVMEEATGTWCPACVRGIAAFEKYEDQWGDRFIGIAVHNSDEMTIETYDKKFRENSGITSFPSGWFNRKAVDTPNEESIVKGILDYNCAYKVEINKVGWNTLSNEVSVDFSTVCCHSLEDSKLSVAAIVLQDRYLGTHQKNGLSGMTKQQAGNEWWPYYERFSKGDAQIRPFEFDHVARGIFPSINGDSEILPSSFQAEIPEKSTLTFKIPELLGSDKENIWQDTSVVILLIDSETGHILTADKVLGNEYSVNGASTESINFQPRPVREVYTDLAGRSILNPAAGSFYIKTVIYDDGSVKSCKTVIK